MPAPTALSLGPEVLGIELAADVTVTSDGWLERALVASEGLDGPPGILQGGTVAGVLAAVARVADHLGAPLTAIDARLHAPTPLGRPLQARVRRAVAAASYEVELRDDATRLASATVELAGHDPAPKVFDLLALASVPLPEPRPPEVFVTCWVCGSAPVHPYGQRHYPGYHGADVVVPFVADDELGDARGTIDPLVVAAVLDCPGVWASLPFAQAEGFQGVVLAGYHVRWFRDAPVMEPLRVVATMDELDGRKVRTRSALVDEDGVTYAVAGALHIGVSQIPDLTAA